MHKDERSKMDKNLKILMEGFSGEIGLTYHFTQMAVSLKKQGLDVVLITTKKEQEEGLKKELEQKGIKYYECKFINKRYWNLLAAYKSLREINTIVKSEHIDILFTHGLLARGVLLPVGLAMRLLLAGRKVPIVEMVHSWRGDPKMIKRLLAWLNAKLANLGVDIWMPVSEQCKQLLITDGFKPEKQRVVHWGIDLEKFDRDKSSSKYLSKYQQLLESLQGKIVVRNSYLYRPKGVEYYLKAIPIVLRVFPETKFLVTGGGPLRGELEGLASRLGIAKSVIFTGEIGRDFFSVILSRTDVGVISSLEETFCIALIDIMAAGKPVIATPVGVAPEIITAKNEIGCLVPLKDPEAIAQAIIELLAHPAKANEMGSKARKLVEEKFTMDVMASRIKEVLKEAIVRKKKDERKQE